MLAFFTSVIVLAATGDGGQGGGFTEFYNNYLNYPGFEAWKFINLAIFIAILIYIAKKPVSEQFRAKREAIRAELIKAEKEKQAALEKLTETEARLVAIESEKESILKRAREEAEVEKANILSQTESEIAKMREQVEGELNRLVQQMKAELRRYSADRSVGLAEEKLRERVDSEQDANLVRAGIQQIGGLN